MSEEATMEQTLEESFYDAPEGMKPGDMPDGFPGHKPKEVKKPEPGPEPEPEAKPDPEPVENKAPKKEWDHDRQQKDIQNANERRQLQTTIDELRTTISTQQAQAQTQAQQEKVADHAKEIERIMESMSDIDATPGDIAKGISKIREIDASAPKSNEANEALLAKITELSERVEASESLLQDNKAEQQRRESSDFLNTVLDDLDKAYGEQYRNEAIQAAKESLKADGFTDTVLPAPGRRRITNATPLFDARTREPGATSKMTPRLMMCGAHGMT